MPVQMPFSQDSATYAAAVTIAIASYIEPMLPYLLAFAAGAMMYVVVEELIPETAEGEHSNIGTIGFAAGFPNPLFIPSGSL